MEIEAYTSPAIAKEMEELYGSSTKIVQIELHHEDEISNYMKMMEEAHKEAAESKIPYR